METVIPNFVNGKTVANVISSLKRKNLIETNLVRDDEQHVTQRFIFVRGFPIEGIPLPELGNTPSLNREKVRGYSGTPSVEYRVDNTISDALEEKIRIKKEKQLKRTAFGGNKPAAPKYTPRPEKKGTYAEDIV